MTIRHLITLAETYSAHVGLAEATIAQHAGSHGRLFSRLRAGESCTVATLDRTVSWFAENWPADLQWPRDVPRPTKRKVA